jgi:hypothetical protein
MAEPADYTPTDIEQKRAFEPDDQGQMRDTWTVHFTTPSGVQTHVKIPATHYTAENVARSMRHHMEQTESVSALAGQPLPSNQPEVTP